MQVLARKSAWTEPQAKTGRNNADVRFGRWLAVGEQDSNIYRGGRLKRDVEWNFTLSAGEGRRNE